MTAQPPEQPVSAARLTFTVKDLIYIVGLLLGMMATYYAGAGDIRLLQFDNANLHTQISTMQGVYVRSDVQEVQNTRIQEALKNMDTKIDEIRKFVKQ